MISLETLPDEVFAQKMLGDGFAIEPVTNVLHSPCAGEIVQLHKSHHAVTIKTKNNELILLHIGINTVNLAGEGFTPFTQVGDQVSVGQKLIEFDLDFIAQKELCLAIVVICLKQENTSVACELKSNKKIISLDDTIAQIRSSIVNPSKNNSNNTQTQTIDYKILMPAGMHARPAARIADLSKTLESKITFKLENQIASTESIVGMLSLGISKGQVIKIQAQGPDASSALEKIKNLLDEITKNELESHTQAVTKVTTPERIFQKHCLYGVSASDGIAIGDIVLLDHKKIDYQEDASDKEVELKRIQTAIQSALEELSKLEDKLVRDNQASKAAIFAAHKEILQDGDLIDEVHSLIKAWKSAEFAWDTSITKRAHKLESLKNELIAARANDIKDVGRRVLLILTGTKESDHLLKKNSIIVAHDLNPSDIVQFDTDKVIGFGTVCGGSTSHVAILARSMGIPAIAGIDAQALELKEGQKVILDANTGTLFTKPNNEQLEKALLNQKAFQVKLQEAMKATMETTYSKDKKRIKVVANIGSSDEAIKAKAIGAEGVGLLRTEFIFLERKDAPSEREQTKIYQDITETLAGSELVIRTLDIGGDKQLSYLPIKAEENPFLGVRGIRFCLRNEGIFREQLRAILNTKSDSPIHIMFPMVGQLTELLKAKEILEEERLKLNAPIPKIGIMIEVPSAALMAQVFAPEVDFFSIGTNDLTQYTLATDRGHSELAGTVDGLNPAVLKLISLTCQAANQYGKWVGVCGGIASDVKAVPVLLGLGVSELSLSMPSIPLIKSTVRQLNINECIEMSEQFLNAKSASEVRSLVAQRWPSI